MAVVVEPIVTSEKLRALLAEQCEHSSLDYKRPLNLAKGNAEGIVELAKDVAAMQSEPMGGYLIIGADDHGRPVAGLTPELAAHFDDATLRQKLGKYLTEPEIRVGEHEVDGNRFVLIYIAPSSAGWCIFRAPGEYEENGKKKYVFRIGDVFVRHGTRSERWTDGDRERIIEQEMERRKEVWRSGLTEELVKQVNLGLAVSSLKEMPVAAMSWDLDAESFKDLVIELLRRNDDIPPAADAHSGQM
jgi:predicted HTH transcriptional regulator